MSQSDNKQGKPMGTKKQTRENGDSASYFRYSKGQKREIRERTRSVVDKYKKMHEGRWYSYLHKNIIKPEKIVITVKTLEQLQEVVADACKKRIAVKAVGSGHSFSDLYQTTGCLIDTHKMCGEIRIERAWLKKRLVGFDGKLIPDPKYLVQIKAGSRIRDLNRKFLHPRGLGILNMGSYDGQTFAGVAATSTHGTGIGLPPIPDIILSLVLVSEDGRAYRIEPANGITSKRAYPDSEPELIQDDDIFNSVIVSMGCMGVIYSVIIQVRDEYMLEERRIVRDWQALRDEMHMNGGLGAEIMKHRHFSVLVNPYISHKRTGPHKEKRMCLVTTMDEVSRSMREGKDPRRQQGLKKCIARQNKFKDAEGVARTINTVFDLLAISNYTNYAHKAFILGGQAIGGYACEWQFPLDTYLQALDVIIETLEQARDAGEQVLTGPIALRFVRASRAFLSPQYAAGNARERGRPGNASCMIEITSLYGTPGRDRQSGKRDDYVLMHRLYQRLIRLGGRPHWGLEFNDLTNAGGRLARLYPEWRTWLKVYRRFNQGTFNNAFTDRIGISM